MCDRKRWELVLPACIVGTALVGAGIGSANAVNAPVAQSLSATSIEHRNLDYRPQANYENDWDKLDILMPAGASNVPVVFFVHGGALMQDDKSDGNYLAPLVRQGVGLVTINYRLSPAVSHPAHIEDTAAAFAWTVKNIASYGGDPNRLYPAGHSAGAYLVALMSLAPSYLGAHGLDFSAIRGVVPISPFLYVEETAPRRDKSVWGTDPKVWMQASVSPYIGKNKPPMLLIMADGDEPWRRDQIERLGAALHKAGHRDTAVRTIPGRGHMTILHEMKNDADPTVKLIAQFVRTH
jgi:acetyl esterase/lipase